MKARLTLPPGAILTRLLIVAGFFLTLSVSLPGHLSYDSVLQLLQGRTGIYSTWHPPVMAWLLGIGDALVPGTALFVFFQSLLSFGTFLSLLAFSPRKPSWPLVCLALVSILSPQLLLYQGIVWKDVLFADTAIAGFVCLAHVARVWPKSGPGMAWFALSIVLLVVSALTRQNGLLVLPVAAAAFGWVASRKTGIRRMGVALGAAALGTMAILTGVATLALGTRSNGDSGPREQFTLLQTYDLSGAVAAEPELPLAHLAQTEPALEQLIRTEGARLYTPIRIDPIAASPSLQTELRRIHLEAINADWRALIVTHPLTHLTNRARVFWWLLATPDIFEVAPSSSASMARRMR